MPFKDTFEKSVKSVLENTETLRTKLKEDGNDISDSYQKILKKIYEDTLDTVKTVSDQVVSAAKKDWFVVGENRFM